MYVRLIREECKVAPSIHPEFAFSNSTLQTPVQYLKCVQSYKDNKDIIKGTEGLMSTNIINCSGVSIVNFEQVNDA